MGARKAAGLPPRPQDTRTRRRGPRRYDWAAIGFLGPLAVLMIGLVVVPIGHTIYYSFTEYSGFDSPHWVGTREYRDLFSDRTFWQVVRTNAWLVLGLLVWVSVPFVLAVMLHGRKRADVLRTILFVPVLLPPVVIGRAFRIIMGDDGPINSALRAVGLGAIAPGWLTDDHLVLVSIALVITWAVMGTGVLFYSAGLAAIPRDRTEAATVDGAEWRHLVWHIYRPALRQVTRFFVLLLTVTTVTYLFPWIFSLTAGGPGIASTTLDYDVFQAGIVAGDYGVASTLAVCSIVFLCLLLGTMVTASALATRWRERAIRTGRTTTRAAIVTARARRAQLASLRRSDPRTRQRLAQALRTAIIAVAVVSVIFPLLWDVRMAFKPEEQWRLSQSSIGGGWTLVNFSHAWTTGQLGHDLLNSLRVVPLGAVLATIVSTLAGYALAKLRFPGRRGVLPLIAMVVFVPLPSLVIPMFNQALSLGYANSRIGLSVVYGALFAAWGTLFMYATFRDLPDELIDSARVDGASAIQTFTRIALPLAKPAIAAVLVINLLAQWNELIVTLVMLPDQAKQTLTVAIASFDTQYAAGGPLTAAAVLIAALPIIVIYGIGQRFMRADTFAGAIKG